MLKKILIGLVVVVGGFFGFAATRPGTYRVERALKIEAPAAVVFAQLDDMKAWAAWSPWDKLDPQMKKTFDGPAKGVGAGYAWQGNDKVGKGKMAVTDSQAPTQIKYRLEFIEPFAAVATTGFALAPDGDKAVGVTWSMAGTNDLMGKVFGIFMDMDKTIGADFEKGLLGLKDVSETEAAKQVAAAAAAAKAQAEAAATAAKAQADAVVAAAAAEAAAVPKGKAKGKAKN